METREKPSTGPGSGHEQGGYQTGVLMIVTARQVANAVGCDRRTVRTVRDQGRVARTVIGRTIAQAMAAMSGVPGLRDHGAG